MVDVATRKKHNNADLELDSQTQTQEEMLTIGEHSVYETRPLLWPYLTKPVLLITIAIAIIVVAQ